jgi:hypothetical protein
VDLRQVHAVSPSGGTPIDLYQVSSQPAAYPNWIQEGFAPSRIPAGSVV